MNVYNVIISSEDTVIHVTVKTLADVARLLRDFEDFCSFYVVRSDM